MNIQEKENIQFGEYIKRCDFLQAAHPFHRAFKTIITIGSRRRNGVWRAPERDGRAPETGEHQAPVPALLCPGSVPARPLRVHGPEPGGQRMSTNVLRRRPWRIKRKGCWWSLEEMLRHISAASLHPSSFCNLGFSQPLQALFLEIKSPWAHSAFTVSDFRLENVICGS